MYTWPSTAAADRNTASTSLYVKHKARWALYIIRLSSYPEVPITLAWDKFGLIGLHDLFLLLLCPIFKRPSKLQPKPPSPLHPLRASLKSGFLKAVVQPPMFLGLKFHPLASNNFSRAFSTHCSATAVKAETWGSNSKVKVAAFGISL